MRVLIVVDMQNDFIDGTLGSQEAVQIVPYVKQKIEAYQKAGNVVMYTRDTHTEDYLNTQEGHNLPVVHCVKNTPGWKIIDQLPVMDDSIIFDKPTFGSVELAQYLKEHHALDSIEFVGVCTDICVISNAMLVKAYLPESEILIDAKGCAGVTVESHETALKAMSACQIKVMK